jgi:hypothetical protein
MSKSVLFFYADVNTYFLGKKMKTSDHFALIFVLSFLVVATYCVGNNGDDDDDVSSDDAEPDCAVEDYCQYDHTCPDPWDSVAECIEGVESSFSKWCPDGRDAILDCLCSCLGLTCGVPTEQNSRGLYGECISECTAKYCPPDTEP